MIHLVVFLISGRRYLTFFTDTQSTTQRVEEKNKWTNTNLGQLQAQKWGVCDTFYAFCELTRACTQAKNLIKPLAILTYLPCPAFISVNCLILSTGLSCSLLLTVSFSFLLPTHLSDFPSLILLVSWEISCASPLSGFCAKTDEDSLTGTYTDPHNECLTSCHM